MPAIGPLDRRRLRTRCVACTRRQIKCEGEVPCVYCSKKGWKCIPQAAGVKGGVVFVDDATVTLSNDTRTASGQVRRHADTVLNCSIIPLDIFSIFAKHFFSAFLVTNNFGGSLDLGTISCQFQNSPSLYHAAIAVGALDFSRKGIAFSSMEAKHARLGALTAYRTSVLGFQNDISNGLQRNYASLWTSFFLGLFELMYDDTGEGFVKHFLYGTSKILQLRGPEAHLAGPGYSFFLTVRVFEICRSLIYSEPTFLAQEDWKALMRQIYANSKAAWHPKEKLFDLMIECSALSHRVWDVLKSDQQYLAFALNSILNKLAIEGHDLRFALNDWDTSFQQWSQSTDNSNKNSQSLLAMTYYHATSIYLSGIFDYRPQFSCVTTPSLSQTIVQHHVDSILSLTQEALRTTNLGGVLMFFPLRVSGARVTSKHEANIITEMLKEISRRSFVVADAFVVDLKELWGCKGILYD